MLMCHIDIVIYDVGVNRSAQRLHAVDSVASGPV